MGDGLSDDNNSEAEVTTASKPKQQRRSRSVLWDFLVWLIAIVALAISAYIYYLFENSQLTQQKVNQASQTQQQQLQKAQQVLAAQQQLAVSLQAQIRKLESQQLALYEANSGFKRRLQELSYTDRSDWQLAEIEYLLRLAHQRVVSNSNAKLGLELLLSADELLRELNNADLFAIREQIASDSLALRNVADIDVEGVYLSLSALVKQVELLQFNKTEIAPEANTPVEDTTGLAKVWQQLASLYRITPREGLLKPLYSQQQQQAISQQLLLSIGQAKQALLTASSSLYVASLAEARDVAQRYVLDSEQRAVFIAELEAFTALEIAPHLPDISGSHAKMRDYIDTKRQRGLLPVASEQAEQ